MEASGVNVCSRGGVVCKEAVRAVNHSGNTPKSSRGTGWLRCRRPKEPERLVLAARVYARVSPEQPILVRSLHRRIALKQRRLIDLCVKGARLGLVMALVRLGWSSKGGRDDDVPRLMLLLVCRLRHDRRLRAWASYVVHQSRALSAVVIALLHSGAVGLFPISQVAIEVAFVKGEVLPKARLERRENPEVLAIGEEYRNLSNLTHGDGGWVWKSG